MKDISKKFWHIASALEFKRLEGFSRPYYANTDGDICRVTATRKLKVLTPWILKGYYYVKLKGDDGKFHNYRVNRLIAGAYHPNPNNEPVADHMNGDTLDNRPCNLRWTSYSENARNRRPRKLHAPT